MGRAFYRLGEWKKAKEALVKGIELRGETEPTSALEPNWWYMTMTLHQLGEVEQARFYYDQLVTELEQNPPTYDSSKYHTEAAEVLGIEIPIEDNPDQTIKKAD